MVPSSKQMQKRVSVIRNTILIGVSKKRCANICPKNGLARHTPHVGRQFAPLIPSRKHLSQSDHRQGVEAAVGEQLCADFLFSIRRCVRVDGLGERGHRGGNTLRGIDAAAAGRSS